MATTAKDYLISVLSESLVFQPAADPMTIADALEGFIQARIAAAALQAEAPPELPDEVD